MQRGLVDERCAGHHGLQSDQFPSQAPAQAGEEGIVRRGYGLQVMDYQVQNGFMQAPGEQDIPSR